LKNEPEKLLKTKSRPSKTNPNKPKNEAEKLLKTRTCGKNEPKNKAGHVLENKWCLKNKPKTNRKRIGDNLSLDVASTGQIPPAIPVERVSAHGGRGQPLGRNPASGTVKTRR